MKTKIIRGGTVVLAQTVSQQDVLIRGEAIAAVGQLGELAADEIIDAGGLLVLPGGVDTHVHFNDAFMGTVSVHDYRTGTIAAAFGGTTSVIDFANQPFGGTLLSTVYMKKEEARGKALIDWNFHPSFTDTSDRTLAEIRACVAAGAPSLKAYMTYRDEGLLVEPPDLKRVLAAVAEAGAMLLVHAEDNDLAEAGIARELAGGRTAPIYHARSKPHLVENKANETAVRLARETGGRLFIVHMTTAEGPELIAKARAAGADVWGETCTHYLIYTEAMLEREDGLKWVCSPPLRTQADVDALWPSLVSGLLSQVTSDDAAYWMEAKRFGKDRFDLIPNGMPGIEPRFHLLYSEGVAKGRLSLPRFVELVATNPAHIYGMRQKGSLLPGKDADIVLFDPTARWTMGQATSHSPCDYHAFEGLEITGRVQKVFSRGDLIVDGDELVAEPGRGRYVHCVLPERLSI